MKTRLTIFCMAALLLTGLLGCQAQTRYRVLCVLFDGVPVPKGMESCDGTNGPGAFKTASAKSEEEAAPHYTSHGPYAAKLCEGCHQRQTNKLILPLEDLCFNCHALDTSTKKMHGPLAAGGCIVCHNPHGSGNQYLLVSKAKDFCLFCHKQADILKKEVHRAGENGCTNCHDPHGSDNDYLLRSTIASVRMKDKPAAELSTQTPKPEEVKNTTPATKNGLKTSQSSPGKAQPGERKNIRSQVPTNGQKTSRSTPGQAQPEEGKSIRSEAPTNSQKTSRSAPGLTPPEEGKSIRSQAPTNGQKTSRSTPGQAKPDEVKSIRSEAPNNIHEDIKTQRDNHQLSLSSAK